MTIKMEFNDEFQTAFGTEGAVEIEVWDNGEVIFTTPDNGRGCGRVFTTIDALEVLVHDANIWMSVRRKVKTNNTLRRILKNSPE